MLQSRPLSEVSCNTPIASHSALSPTASFADKSTPKTSCARSGSRDAGIPIFRNSHYFMSHCKQRIARIWLHLAQCQSPKIGVAFPAFLAAGLVNAGAAAAFTLEKNCPLIKK